MTTKTTQIDAKPHPGQGKVHRHSARFKVLAAGRRWGKTRLGVHECLDVASRGGRAWWVAPSYKLGEVGWRPLRRFGTKIGAEVRKVDRQVILPNGGDVTVRSADDPDSLRGEGLDLVILDECAFMKEGAWTESLRPSLSDRLGKAIFISTPKGRGWFWRLWLRGSGDREHDVGYPEWKSWQLPTSDNPYIEPSEIEAARLTLPEAIFEQEYLAVFLENQGAVFRNILACMNAPKNAVLKDHKEHRIVAGVDWGKQADFTAISVGCSDCKKEVTIDRFNKIDYVFQRGRLQVIAEKWEADQIVAEANSMGDPIIEMLQRSGLPVSGFQTTASSKPPLIENLALVLEREEWQFLDDPTWKLELEAYERKVSPTTGRSTYSAPEGLYDDTVMARALMVWSGNMPSGADLVGFA